MAYVHTKYRATFKNEIYLCAMGMFSLHTVQLVIYLEAARLCPIISSRQYNFEVVRSGTWNTHKAKSRVNLTDLT